MSRCLSALKAKKLTRTQYLLLPEYQCEGARTWRGNKVQTKNPHFPTKNPDFIDISDQAKEFVIDAWPWGFPKKH